MPKPITYHRILAMVEFGPQDAQVIRQAKALALGCGAQLQLLHIVDTEPTMDGGVGLTPRQEAYAYESLAITRLRRLARTARISECECHVRVGHPVLAFSAFTHEQIPDLVVTACQTEHVANGNWDVLTVNRSSTPWPNRFRRWFKGERADFFALASTHG